MLGFVTKQILSTQYVSNGTIKNIVRNKMSLQPPLTFEQFDKKISESMKIDSKGYLEPWDGVNEGDFPRFQSTETVLLSYENKMGKPVQNGHERTMSGCIDRLVQNRLHYTTHHDFPCSIFDSLQNQTISDENDKYIRFRINDINKKVRIYTKKIPIEQPVVRWKIDADEMELLIQFGTWPHSRAEFKSRIQTCRNRKKEANEIVDFLPGDIYPLDDVNWFFTLLEKIEQFVSLIEAPPFDYERIRELLSDVLLEPKPGYCRIPLKKEPIVTDMKFVKASGYLNKEGELTEFYFKTEKERYHDSVPEVTFFNEYKCYNCMFTVEKQINNYSQILPIKDDELYEAIKVQKNRAKIKFGNDSVEINFKPENVLPSNEILKAFMYNLLHQSNKLISDEVKEEIEKSRTKFEKASYKLKIEKKEYFHNTFNNDSLSHIETNVENKSKVYSTQLPGKMGSSATQHNCQITIGAFNKMDFGFVYTTDSGLRTGVPLTHNSFEKFCYTCAASSNHSEIRDGKYINLMDNCAYINLLDFKYIYEYHDDEEERMRICLKHIIDMCLEIQKEKLYPNLLIAYISDPEENLPYEQCQRLVQFRCMLMIVLKLLPVASPDAVNFPVMEQLTAFNRVGYYNKGSHNTDCFMVHDKKNDGITHEYMVPITENRRSKRDSESSTENNKANKICKEYGRAIANGLHFNSLQIDVKTLKNYFEEDSEKITFPVPLEKKNDKLEVKVINSIPWTTDTTFSYSGKRYKNMLKVLEINCDKDDEDSNVNEEDVIDKCITIPHEIYLRANSIVFMENSTYKYVSNRKYDHPLTLACPCHSVYKTTTNTKDQLLMRPFPTYDDLTSMSKYCDEKYLLFKKYGIGSKKQ